ncbi:MAG: DUF3810 domain-containing protein [Cellulosilyticaceae bacterium]
MLKSIKKQLLILLLIPIAMLLGYWYTKNPIAWEKFYSLGINKSTIRILSLSFGLFPFSVFELLVALAIISLIIYMVYILVSLFRRIPHKGTFVLRGFCNLLAASAIVYFVFMAFWGLNYKRPHFSVVNGVEVRDYTPEELGKLYSYLLQQADKVRQDLPEDAQGMMLTYGDYKDIFNRAKLGYEKATLVFSSLSGNYGKPKPFAVSPVLNHTGITGMYSPFTGEPNVNIAILPMNIPATTCHEMAHQRGYTFEDECNFISYLTCTMHPDADFQYSGYIMAIAYTSNALAKADPQLLHTLNQQMPIKIYNDLGFNNRFRDQYAGEVEQMATEINNSYLEANGISSGTQNYGQMVNLLLSYYDFYF